MVVPREYTGRKKRSAGSAEDGPARTEEGRLPDDVFILHKFCRKAITFGWWSMTRVLGAIVSPSVVDTTHSPRDYLKAGSRAAKVPLHRFLRPKMRSSSLARFKAATAWLMRTRLGLSLPEIASWLEYRDHTTVMYHLRRTCLRPDTIVIMAEVARHLEVGG